MLVWAAHVKKHEWAVVTDAGHAVTWEQPETFNAKVLEFIQRH
jgi:pimeloyl-ACP methyl ester carboxylesterase